MNYTWTPPVIEPNPIQKPPPQVSTQVFLCWIGDTVAFNGGKQVLTIVPIKALRMAATTLTELTKLIPFASVNLASNEAYSLALTKWSGDSTVKVALMSDESPRSLYTWDLEDIDPS